jgi:hypothetical protein
MFWMASQIPFLTVWNNTTARSENFFRCSAFSAKLRTGKRVIH